MTVSEAVKKAKAVLNNVPDRDVDAAWIVCHVTGLTRSQLHFEGERALSQSQQAQLDAVLERRKLREPLQYIFGYVPFYNVQLKTDARALIPRDETALLAEAALKLIESKNYKTVLDLCTGSGAIAIAIKKNSDATVTASDISASALSLAGENAELNGTAVEFVESDLFSAFGGRRFDCILSNPPYIPTKDIEKLEKELSFEPENALDGGADGLDFYRDIIAQAPDHLNKGGLLMLEIGFDQALAVKTLLLKSGFGESFVLKDYAGLDRIVYTFL